MRIHCYLRNMRTRQGVSEHVLAAAAGFRRHGFDPQLVPVGQPAPCDLAVCWGVKKLPEMASGRRALILERGYLGDRLNTWTSVGFDGLNGRADFRNAGADSSRWDRHFAATMKPWLEPSSGDYVLVLGQVAGDASLRGLDVDRWAAQTMLQLRSRGIPALFRPHPQAAVGARVVNLPRAEGDLAAVLDRAMWAVTYNSNSGVDAVMAGIPTVAIDAGSMAWPVTGRVPYLEPPTPDRARWGAELAWTQWTLAEIKNGDAWDHLRQGLPS